MLNLEDLNFPKEKSFDALYSYCFKLHEYLKIILSKEDNANVQASKVTK